MKDKEKVITEQEAKQAVAPTSQRSSPSFIAEAIKEAKEARMKPKEADDNVLAEGADSEFWRLIKKYIENSLKKLKDNTTKAAMESGFNLELLGFRYVLMDQISNFGGDIIKFVETRQKVVELMKKAEMEKEKAKAERLRKREERR